MFSKNILANRLTRLRAEKNIMAKDVAAAVGVTKAAISKIESGQRAVSVELLAKLACFFDTSSDYLLGLVDDPAPPRKDDHHD